jgi:hypothetical protein
MIESMYKFITTIWNMVLKPRHGFQNLVHFFKLREEYTGHLKVTCLPSEGNITDELYKM